MTQKDEWGPWIEHDGKGCPVVGQYVQDVCRFRDGHIWETEGVVSSQDAEGWDWSLPSECGFFGELGRVIRYRIRKPRGLTILEDIAQGVREPEGV